MAKRIVFIALFVFTIVSILPSCSVNYNFTGSKPMVLEKTFSVYYFPNRARLVNPTLSQSFTEALREKITRQTSLDEVKENGDVEFEGQITGYEFRPITVAKDDASQQTRLTITLKLTYTNHKVPEDDIEKTFSSFEDFDSSESISSVEDELTEAIIEKLLDDIFNTTIASW